MELKISQVLLLFQAAAEELGALAFGELFADTVGEPQLCLFILQEFFPHLKTLSLTHNDLVLVHLVLAALSFIIKRCLFDANSIRIDFDSLVFAIVLCE